MRTAQEIFTHVVTHLRKQNQKSHVVVDDKNYDCLYRSPEGLSCAVGCLIPNDKYKPEMESKNIDALLFNKQFAGILTPDLVEEFTAHRKLLLDLQNLHDGWKIEAWEERFKTLANRYSVTLP